MPDYYVGNPGGLRLVYARDGTQLWWNGQPGGVFRDQAGTMPAGTWPDFPSLYFQRPGTAPTGGVTYQPPSQQNWPGGGGTPNYDLGYTPGGSNFPSGYAGSGSWMSEGGEPGGGGFDWKQLILQGIPILTNYLGARQQAGQAKKLQKAGEQQRAQTLALASPERYLQNYSSYLGAFQNAYRPWLVGEQDRAAIGESTAMQGFEADVARRGLSGSGLAISGRSAIRTGRQAQIGENMRRYKQMIEEGAREAAGQTRSAELSASLGAPVPYIPRPSPWVEATKGLGDAYNDWLWLQSTENNPFESRKPNPYYR